MPNIATVLKQEIARIARKELRSETASVKKASTQHRRAIAELKRQVQELQRQASALAKQIPETAPALPSDAESARVRFTAKGLKSQRKRLGLSASQYAGLVGVTPQSIYNWEQGTSSPRKAQVATLAGLRKIGKKEANAQLEQLVKAAGKKKAATTRKKKSAGKKK